MVLAYWEWGDMSTFTKTVTVKRTLGSLVTVCSQSRMMTGAVIVKLGSLKTKGWKNSEKDGSKNMQSTENKVDEIFMSGKILGTTKGHSCRKLRTAIQHF